VRHLDHQQRGRVSGALDLEALVGPDEQQAPRRPLEERKQAARVVAGAVPPIAISPAGL